MRRIVAAVVHLFDRLDTAADAAGAAGSRLERVGSVTSFAVMAAFVAAGWIGFVGSGSPVSLVVALAITLGVAWLIRYRWRRSGADRPSSRALSTDVVTNSAPIVERESVPNQLRWKVLQRDGFRCVYCGHTRLDGARLEIDHLQPVSKGGRTHEDNLVTACFECNRAKSAKVVIQS